jgi:hypothetical protein
MELFPAVLYIHVIATLALVAVMGMEGAAMRQGNTEPPPQRTGLRVTASVCLAVLFLSGGLLTDRAGLWKMAWPKFAVVIVLAFGALAGISSRRRMLQTRLVRISFSIRCGLILAAVWLMVLKPNGIDSLGVVLAFVMIFWGLAALIKGDAPVGVAAAGPTR